MSGTSSFTSVPVVEISGLHSPDRAQREQVAREIGKAAGEVGFFYVSGAGVDDAVFERMLAATKEFFALPADEKMRYYIGLSKCHRGYVPPGEEGLATGVPEVKEAFDTALDLPADDPDYLAGNPMLGPNTWPDLAGFADAVTAYYRAVLDVGHGLLWAFAVALGEDPDTFSKHATKTPSQLRLIHYPYNPDARRLRGDRRAHRLRMLHPAQAHRAWPRGAQRRGRLDRRAASARHLRRQHRRHAGTVDQRRIRGDQPPGPRGEGGALLVPAVLQRRLPHRGQAVAAVRLSRR